MPTPLHTAPDRPVADRVFAAREQMLAELYDAHGSAGARNRLDQILAGHVVTSRSGRSVELVLHEDGPVLETLTVLRRLDGVYMAIMWGLIDGGARADHPVRGEHVGLWCLARELVDRLDGGVLAEMERSGSSCICGPDSTGEAPDVRPDCVPCNESAADIGENPF